MQPLLIFLLLCGATALHAQIEWLSWEEAVERNSVEPKRMLVDVYTEWCGWCKKMDQSVFSQPEVADYVNENFYAVKLDAEQRATIAYDGHEFTYDATVGRRGIHSLAVALLDGRMSYPSIVYLDDSQKRITISPGYKSVRALMKELTYVGEGHYRTTAFQDYRAEKEE